MASSMLEVLGSAHSINSINTSRLAAESKGRIQLHRADGIDSAVLPNYPPLTWAAILDNRVGVEGLTHAGAMVNPRDSGDGHTALTAQSILSPRDGYSMSSTQLLLDGGVRQDLRSEGPHALQNALFMQKWGLAKILIDAGTPVTGATCRSHHRCIAAHYISMAELQQILLRS
jgi:hypothetical protein